MFISLVTRLASGRHGHFLTNTMQKFSVPCVADVCGRRLCHIAVVSTVGYRTMWQYFGGNVSANASHDSFPIDSGFWNVFFRPLLTINGLKNAFRGLLSMDNGMKYMYEQLLSIDKNRNNMKNRLMSIDKTWIIMFSEGLSIDNGVESYIWGFCL